LLLAFACLAVLAARPYLTVLTHGNDVLKFAVDQQAQRIPLFTLAFLKEGIGNMHGQFGEANPLLLFLGLGGAFVLPQKSVRRWFVPLLLSFAVIAAFACTWKPHLELDRMAIPLMFLAIVPAALVCARVLKTRHPLLALARAAVISALILTGVTVARLYCNEGVTPYTVFAGSGKWMVDWIKQHSPAQGRILFAGCALHDFGRGHIAYLPVFTGHEMMACDYYHFPPSSVEYDYPPKMFRGDEGKMFQFFSLYNVTQIATWHKEWKEYFRKCPEHYTEEAQFEDKTVFSVRLAPSMCAAGEGKVEAAFNRIAVEPAPGTTLLAIKYNWVEGLRATPPATIFPYSAAAGITLIGIHPNGAARLEIRYPNRWF